MYKAQQEGVLAQIISSVVGKGKNQGTFRDTHVETDVTLRITPDSVHFTYSI